MEPKRKADKPAGEQGTQKKSKKNKKKKHHAKEPQPKQEKLFKEEELHCIVCFEFPPREIFQCENGHLLCQACHTRVVEGRRPECPTCRAVLRWEQPSRNRFAERVLAAIRVPCENSPCPEKLPFAIIRTHQNEACPFRTVHCKYEPIGCDWKAMAKDKKEHQKTCKIKCLTSKDILKLVLERNVKKDKEKQAIQEQATAFEQVCSAISSRCRNLTVRDVYITHDSLCNELVSKTFMVFNIAWEAVILAPKKTGEEDKVRLVLRIVSPTVSNLQPLLLRFFVLRGPELEVELPPSNHKALFSFSAGKKKSDPCLLPFTKEEAIDINARSSINLRIGFIDVSHGHAVRNFSTMPPPPMPNSDAEIHSSSDTEDDDGEGNGYWGTDDYGRDYEDSPRSMVSDLIQSLRS